MKRLLFILLLICVLPAYAQWSGVKPMLGEQIEDHDPSLVGFWLMNEGGGNTVYDLSGNSRTGTLVGGPSWVGGQFGSALSFNGSYINTGYHFTDMLEFTWSMWVIIGDSTIDYLMDNSNGSVGYIMRATGPVVDLYVYDSASSAHNVQFTMDRFVWHELVWVHTIAGDSVYVDGVYTNGSSWDASAGVKATTTSLTLAAEFDGTDTLVSTISHVMVHSKALAASERTSLYHDPFQMFRREPTELYVTAAAPPAGGGQVIMIMGGVGPVVLIVCLAVGIGCSRKAA